MDLIQIFAPESIKTDMEAVDKEEVFEELTDFICRVEDLEDREGILEAIYERETKMSTGIRTGIAIPHGKTDVVDRLCGVMGISKKGVDYESLDGKPVHLFFFMLSPEMESEQHLRLLKRLAQMLDNPDFYTELAAAGTSAAAFATLKKYEDIVTSSD
jgi:PTS system fructose-specific IIC component/PTS system nitrogen regulatory IIA component